MANLAGAYRLDRIVAGGRVRLGRRALAPRPRYAWTTPRRRPSRHSPPRPRRPAHSPSPGTWTSNSPPTTTARKSRRSETCHDRHRALAIAPVSVSGRRQLGMPVDPHRPLHRGSRQPRSAEPDPGRLRGGEGTPEAAGPVRRGPQELRELRAMRGWRVRAAIRSPCWAFSRAVELLPPCRGQRAKIAAEAVGGLADRHDGGEISALALPLASSTRSGAPTAARAGRRLPGR